MSDMLLVYMTAPSAEVAIDITKAVVGERLAACGNLLPGVRSIYRWQGEICDDAEVLVLFKTTSAGFEALAARVVELHPYDCPEVIAVDIVHGHAPYLEWVARNVH